MPTGFCVVENINRPIWVVWAFLTDFRNAPKWMTGVEELVLLDGSEIKAGTRYRLKSRGSNQEGKVTSYEPAKIALTSNRGRITATYTYRLRDQGDGTIAVLEARCDGRGLWKLAAPLITLLMRRSDCNQLFNLKQAILASESQHG